MAALKSFRSYRSPRVREDSNNGNAQPGITNSADGRPCLDIEIKPSALDEATDRARIYRLTLSPEETEAIARVIYRSGAHGMNQLRAKYEPNDNPS